VALLEQLSRDWYELGNVIGKLLEGDES